MEVSIGFYSKTYLCLFFNVGISFCTRPVDILYLFAIL